VLLQRHAYPRILGGKEGGREGLGFGETTSNSILEFGGKKSGGRYYLCPKGDRKRKMRIKITRLLHEKTGTPDRRVGCNKSQIRGTKKDVKTPRAAQGAQSFLCPKKKEIYLGVADFVGQPQFLEIASRRMVNRGVELSAEKNWTSSGHGAMAARCKEPKKKRDPLKDNKNYSDQPKKIGLAQ